MRLILFSCLALLVTFTLGQHECETITDLVTSGEIDQTSTTPCTLNPCDPDSATVTSQEDCPTHCAFYNNNCFLKSISIAAIEAKYGNSTEDDDLEERNYQIGGGSSLYRYPPAQYPPFYPPHSPCPLTFPENCRINPNDPNIFNLLAPPVDVPYCQRIACNSHDPSLETNRLGCHSQPGCYFDVELAIIRRAAGHTILPGVPVCHLAIRNKAFKRLVNKYEKTSNKKWNGLYTKCLINQNLEEIYAQPAGCYMVDVLQYIGIKPKRAGWRGMSPKDCSLIGGCSKPGLHCFYPAELHKIKVRSGEDTHRKPNPSPRDIYGQPMCLPFNQHASPVDFLSNYHYCLQSGCVLDSSLSYRKVRDVLYNITTTVVPQQYRHAFWNKVCSGHVRPDNWRVILRQISFPIFTPQPNPYVPLPFSHEINSSEPIAQGRDYGLGDFFGHGKNPLPYCPGDAPSYPTGGQGYPTGGHGYPTGGQGYPTGGQGYPTGGHGYPTGGQGYPTGGQGYPTGGQGYPQGPLNPQPYSYQQPPSHPRPPIYPLPQYPPFPQFPYPRPQPCPYANHHLRGYLKLKGSFSGCCEKNLCYIPRPQLYNPHSGIAPYYSHWESWSACSKTCAGGQRTRKRPCVSYKKENCYGGEETQTETCNLGECPYYQSWTNWSPCSKTCGGGRQERSRVCYPNGKGCSGGSKESRNCQTGSCPTLAWSAWSKCSSSCGTGQKHRTRTCTHPGAYECPEDKHESADCWIYSGKPVLTTTTACEYPICQVTKHYKCQCPDGGNGHCIDFKPKVSERCYEGYCGGFFGK